MILPFICLVLGVALGLLIGGPIRGDFGVYVGVACLAGMDAVCGGIRSQMEGKFDGKILVTGFFANIAIAYGLSWLGDRIGANIFLVCAFIFGQRIFTNLSVIRRMVLTKWELGRARREEGRNLG
ncbi:MAG: small basic family protein [Armatimonadetes bacterium]|nr:small basic family protein [Armatimonadota bacterium]